MMDSKKVLATSNGSEYRWFKFLKIVRSCYIVTLHCLALRPLLCRISILFFKVYPSLFPFSCKLFHSLPYLSGTSGIMDSARFQSVQQGLSVPKRGGAYRWLRLSRFCTSVRHFLAVGLIFVPHSSRPTALSAWNTTEPVGSHNYATTFHPVLRVRSG